MTVSNSGFESTEGYKMNAKAIAVSVADKKNEDRIATERKIVRHMIRTLKAAGWAVYGVDDGGDGIETLNTEAEMVEAIFAVDESRAYFINQTAGNKKHVVVICLGNGIDVIVDHSMSDKDTFAATMGIVDEYIFTLYSQQ